MSVSDITVTARARQEALYAAITALVRAGMKGYLFRSSYDSYAPAVALSGGVLKRIALTRRISRRLAGVFRRLAASARVVILNTPHNPTATVWRQGGYRGAVAGLSASGKFM